MRHGNKIQQVSIKQKSLYLSSIFDSLSDARHICITSITMCGLILNFGTLSIRLLRRRYFTDSFQKISVNARFEERSGEVSSRLSVN